MGLISLQMRRWDYTDIQLASKTYYNYIATDCGYTFSRISRTTVVQNRLFLSLIAQITFNHDNKALERCTRADITIKSNKERIAT